MKNVISATILFIIAKYILSCGIDNIDNLDKPSLNRSSNPIKVFILAGQSNMEGKGVVEPDQGDLDKNNGKGTLRYLVNKVQNSQYKHLVNSSGEWSMRNDVWLVEPNKSGPLTVKGRKHIGPELQFGHVVGKYYKNSQVLIIKTAWGGKSLYVDFRPPSSNGEVGPYYEIMIDRVHEVLDDIKNFYPDYNGQGYEIAGFGWHQGWNDRVNKDAVDQYQENCVNLINDLRDEFNLPGMPFVLATTGMKGWSTTSEKALALMNAQLAVPNDNRLNEKKNVFAVETRDHWRDEADSPSKFGFHWNNNAETYFLIGNGIGEAMTGILAAEEEEEDQLNQAPVIDAGNDISILVEESVTIQATANDDGLPNAELSISWTQTSGPVDMTIDDATLLRPTITFSQTGTYTLRLLVDDGDLAAQDEIQIQVSSQQADISSMLGCQTSSSHVSAAWILLLFALLAKKWRGITHWLTKSNPFAKTSPRVVQTLGNIPQSKRNTMT